MTGISLVEKGGIAPPTRGFHCIYIAECILNLVATAGLEPATQGFSILCSTIGAMQPNWYIVTGLNRRPPPCKGIALPLS